MDSVEKFLQYEYDKLDKYAEALLDEFWDERKANIEERGNSEKRALLGCRFKGRHEKLRIVWYHNKFYGPKNKKRVISTEFSKPRGKHKYATAEFNKTNAVAWEVRLASEIEKELCKIRARKAELDEVKKGITKYQKNISEMDL